MTWRLAKSLEKLREQINAAYPNRDKSSDGSIGDEHHSSRTSDHNPNEHGVVCALDFTNDPPRLVASDLADTLRRSGDPRLKYIISNRRIADPHIQGGAWRPYHGTNPHDHHFHISVRGTYDVTTPWNLGEVSTDIPAVLADTAGPKPETPILRRGSEGAEVEKLQALLHVTVDGDFGPLTEQAVRNFQLAHKLVVDGRVGFYTMRELEA